MTINEIMLREMFDAEKEEREAAVAGARQGSALVKWGCVAGGVLAVATILFLAWCLFSETPHRMAFPL